MIDAPPSNAAWDWIYATRQLNAVGWYEPDPTTSRELVTEAIGRGGRSVIDIGAGASTLVDHLLDVDLERIALLDISAAGLAISRHRLGTRTDDVEWFVGDVAEIDGLGQFDIWHDRAAFHFLLDDAARDRYTRLAGRTVRPGGSAIIATFAQDGPERCSGMPVRRYDAPDLAAEFGDAFRLIDSRRYVHHTPAGVPQSFQYSTLERVDPVRDDG